MQLTKKSKAIVAGVALAGLAGTGTAYAYWTTSGSGTGTAATSAGTSNLVVSQTTIFSAMYPGDVGQTISGTVTNSAAQSAYVTAVTASIASVTQTSAGLALGVCDTSDYTLVGPVMLVGKDLAMNAQAGFTGASLKFNNKTTNQDGCKGATVNLAYAAS